MSTWKDLLEDVRELGPSDGCKQLYRRVKLLMEIEKDDEFLDWCDQQRVEPFEELDNEVPEVSCGYLTLVVVMKHYPNEEDWGRKLSTMIAEIMSQESKKRPKKDESRPGRLKKEKKQFICGDCGSKKQSSQLIPNKWINVYHGAECFPVCSKRCWYELHEKLDKETFIEGYKMPSGKHECVLLVDVDHSYLIWSAENIESEGSLIRKAAEFELHRLRVVANDKKHNELMEGKEPQ